MNKPYFTKYLPVPGEIKKGDLWKEAGSDHLHYGQLEATLKKANEAGHKKVKQFLCSRDIQVGDRIRGEYPSTEGFDVECLRTFERHASVPHWVVRGIDGKEYYYDKNNAFKVIGEVSPNALWVKEGMEFDENDWKLVVISRENLPPFFLDKKHRFTIDNKTLNVRIAFKCPTCNTFH